MRDALRLRRVDFSYRSKSSLTRRKSVFRVLKNIDLSLPKGSCVGIIGESGSGKSTLARIITGILQPDRGTVEIDGQCVSQASRSLALRQHVQMVFQDPSASLNPAWPIWRSIAEGLLVNGVARLEAKARAIETMERVNLDRDLANNRPHALSGGQRQRVAIARALAVDPGILILDEPTSALDLTVQAGFLNLLLELQSRSDLSFLLITHDIDVIRHLAEHVYVMRQGVFVEHGDCQAVLKHPSHSYTERLIEASPQIAVSKNDALAS